MAELDRRDFLKLVGAGAGAAAASGCSDLPQKLIPYVVQPEEITPGLPMVYASTCLECPVRCGLHVSTREGRPVKLEGSPDHPVNRGALCARGQAGIGRTYHPDRFRGPMERVGGELRPITWEQAVSKLAGKVRSAGAQTRVLGAAAGPTLDGLIDRWISAVGAGERLVYEPFAHEALSAATEAVFGVQGRPRFDLEDADFILDFGSDFLESWLSPTEHARQFAAARDVGAREAGGARLVYVGPRLALTTDNADEWLPARPGTEGLLALGVARAALDQAVAAGRPVGGDAGLLASVLSPFDAVSVASRTGVSADDVRRLGRELASARRPAALPPGVALTSRRATATAAAVLLLDAVVGAIGTTVHVEPDAGGKRPASFREIARLIDAMRAGDVAVLIVHDANPVYSLPGVSGFADAIERVDFVVSTASMPDETTERADLILPDHTPLESWGDAAPRPGVRSIVQPTLRPLYDTQALGDTLLAVGRAISDDVAAALPAGSFRSVLEAAWEGSDFRGALQRGGLFEEAPVPPAPAVAASIARIEFAEPQLEGEGPYTVVTPPSPLLYDGRGANLPWLQETADPVTKVAWQSWAEVSHETARSLGVDTGDVLAVETSFGRVEVPAFPRGGIRDDVVALAIGQGHTVGTWASLAGDGRPGEARGVSAISLLPALTDEHGGRAWLTARARLSATGRHQRLPVTQGTDNKRGRQLGEMVSLSALAAHETAAFAGEAGQGGEHGGEHLVAYDPTDDSAGDSAYRWGMTIDLDRCTGCSACMVACSIENNIPIVGEEGVLRSRQMYWIRIERYVGDGYQELRAGRPGRRDHEQLGVLDVRHSPMLCQQCGAAPCEPVCPVFATYHNPEGLNGMIYNRCIGTRYCSNNCPYKVRRFNWFDYQIETWPEPMYLMLNPDVTVRGQGVMEKCTFCVQRIQRARQTAKDEGRPIADGEVTPACAQTCPTQAITFGNLKDDGSRVVQHAVKGEARSYHALQVLNTRPAIHYLAKVRRGSEADHDDGGHHG